MNANRDGRFRIAYGTYGMPEEDIRAAIPRLSEIGYEGLEICVGEAYPTAPQKLSKEKRSGLRTMVSDLELEIPSLMLLSRVLTHDLQEYQQQLEAFRAAAELANDLAVGNRIPVLTTTLGGGTMTWEKDREALADRIAEVGEIIAEAGTRFAVEPHVGSILENPHHAVWLIRRINSPAVRLNFDISHFAVAGYPLEDTVARLAPLAIHTHVKDGRMATGRVEWLLPGEGDFDYTAYFREMAKADWRGCITVEISGMIFSKPNYDPWGAGVFSWNTLRAASKEALI
ncbi:MAG: sugar phosphate isomerase/epimerase [Candidatus Poribacteria bacterium]|nr:sugar phosphate isomerase/epimerase [Candidatus Poribacteria bacterium]